MSGITRREALWSLASLVGLPGWFQLLLQQTGKPTTPGGAFLALDEMADVTRLCDGILPGSGTGGALAAGAPAFIDSLLFESDSDVQKPFVAGLSAVVQRAHAQHGGRPAQINDAALEELVKSLDNEAIRVTLEPQMAIQETRVVYWMPVLDTQHLAPADRARVEFHVALRCLVITAYITSPLATPVMFHADYAGCRHPEHRPPEGH